MTETFSTRHPHRPKVKITKPNVSFANMKTILLFALSLIACTNHALALIDFGEIHSPDQLPKGLLVKSVPNRETNGLITVAVTFAPDAPELYRDRVKVFGQLTVNLAGKLIAESQLKSAQTAGTFTMTFRLAREAFPESELRLSTQLYEKDGLPTVGGGVIYKINLQGFHPLEEK